MTAQCRAGHVSDESDYCSVCGIAIAAPAAPAANRVSRNTPLPASVRRALPGACPACGEPRAEPDARFCEVCRYDFVSAKPGPPPVGARPSAPPARVTASWEVVVAVDASLDTEPDADAPCPKDSLAVVVPLDRAELLIGRHDDRRDIHPELPVHDPGASRRHAKLATVADGAVVLQDLASTNGTRVNGVEVAPGSRTPLAEGDHVTLGRWTRISLRRKA